MSQLNRRSFVLAIAVLLAGRRRPFVRHNRKRETPRITLVPVETKEGFWVLLPVNAPAAGFEIDPLSKMVIIGKRRRASLEAVELDSGFVVLLPIPQSALALSKRSVAGTLVNAGTLPSVALSTKARRS